MANKNKKQRTVLSKEAEGTLTASEILHREAEYRKDLGDYKKGLIAGERFKAEGIKKLAKKLEAAGTVETNRISRRIKADLASLIENKVLTINYIHDVLDVKYKRSEGYEQQNRCSDEEEGSEQTEISQEPQTTETEAEETDAEEKDTPSSSPISVREELEHDNHVDDQFHFIRGLTELLTGLKEEELLNRSDNLKLVEETKKYRFGVVKRLDDLNLKTLYGNARTLGLVLNDYLKQLDDEVGVRQSKGELLTE